MKKQNIAKETSAKKTPKKKPPEITSGCDLTIVWRPIDSITPYDNNPRKISEAAVKKVAQQIQQFGFDQPIVVDRAGVIIKGHTRRLAALRLKLDRVPVFVAEHLTPEQARLSRIGDNRSGEEAAWDEALLGLEMTELHAALGTLDGGLADDLLQTGFDPDELSQLLGFEQDLPSSGESDKTEAVDRWYGGATAMSRGSIPWRFWSAEGYLAGRVLDFGCGRDDSKHATARYDPFHATDTAPLLDCWDRVVCNYVLNVQPSDHLITLLCALMSRLVAPGGEALVAVTKQGQLVGRDGEDTGSGIQRSLPPEQWESLIGQFFWVERVADEKFYGFVCTPMLSESVAPSPRKSSGRSHRRTPRSGAAAKRGS